MRKIVTLILIIAISFTCISSVTVFADSADLREVAKTAFHEFDNMLPENKTELLKNLWDFVLGRLDGTDVDTLMEILRDNVGETVWNKMISSGASTPGDGKISEGSLRTLLQVIINNSAVFTDIYDDYNEFFRDYDSFIKKSLTGKDDASPGEVLVELLKLEVPVLKDDPYDSSKFSPNDNLREVLVDTISDKLGLEKDSVLRGLLENYYDDVDVDAKASDLANRVNCNMAERNIQKSDVVIILNMFGLYKKQITPTPTPPPVTPPPGGGGPVLTSSPTPTATPGASPSPTPDISHIKEELAKSIEPESACKLLNMARDLISEIEDPDEAVDAAGELISVAGQSTDTADVKVQEALLNIATTALTRISASTIEAQVTDNTAAAAIDDEKVEELLARIEKVAEKARELTSKLEESGVAETAPAVLNINVSSTEPVDEVNIEIPGKVFIQAAEKELDQVVINTEVATIAVPPETLEVEEDSKVSVSAKKVDLAELTEEVAEIVGDNPVFDFKIKADDEIVTNFNSPIEVSVPYELKEGENPDTITVFYLRENTDTEDSDDYMLENVIGVYDPVTKTVRFTTKHFSTYVVKQNPVTFSDVGKATKNREYIEAMAAKGIVVGYDGMFRPGGTFTRAEVCAIVVKTLKLYDDDATCDFDDVKEGDWYYKHVASAYNAGIISGRPGNVFDPHARMTRQEVATIVSNALIKIMGKAEIKEPDRYLSQYTDVENILPYARSPVALMTKYSIMGPKFGKSFRPSSPVTRAEAAEVFYNLLNVK